MGKVERSVEELVNQIERGALRLPKTACSYGVERRQAIAARLNEFLETHSP